MRLAINAWSLMSPHTGVASYTRNLAIALLRTGAVEPFFFYGFSWSSEIRNSAVPGIGMIRTAVTKLVPQPYALVRSLQQRYFDSGIRRFAFDLYHEPSFLPFRFPGPTVITVHDLSPMRYPETHPKVRVAAMNKYLPAAIERAAQIIVDSEFVEKEVVSHFGVDPAKVHAIHLGVGESYAPRTIDEIAPVLARYGLTPKGYIFAVGTLEPRKNLRQAIDAYAGLPVATRRSVPLVVAGMRGWLAGDLEARIREFEARGEMRWLGYVPADTLPFLYSGASMLVYPSLYEGFGLPVLEAMASGIPVITSNRAALPEVAGEAAIMVDPDDHDALRDAMLRMLEDEQEAKHRSELGLAQAARFTWRACAEKTLAVYRKAMSE